MSDNNPTGWHLDKKVPIALILAMGIQIATAAVFITRLSDQAASNTEDIAKIEDDISALVKEEGEVQKRVIRIEERLHGNFRILERIERVLYGKPR